MALMKDKFSNIPTDAVILNEEDALSYQLNLIQKWKKDEDVWIFKYGYSILASLSAISSIYINNHYRVKFRLLNYGRISSYLPVVVLPAVVSGMFHQEFVVTDVALAKSCPVCVQLRAASLQASFSTLFPAIIAPLAALPFAIQYNTYNVPLITKEPMKLFKMMVKLTKPIGNILLGIMAFQGLAAALITYKEQLSILNIQNTLSHLEKQLEGEHENINII